MGARPLFSTIAGMARITLDVDAQVLVSTGGAEVGSTDALARSFLVLAPGGAGSALLKRGTIADGPPDMSDAARWDFSKFVLSYSCEPGMALYASVAAGTLDLDILEGGER